MAQASYVTNAIHALITGTGQPREPARTAHTEFIVALAQHPPRPIPVGVNTADLDERADHFATVFIALSVYMTTLLQDTAQNVPGGLDLRSIDTLLSDLVSDVIGVIRRAADALVGRVE